MTTFEKLVEDMRRAQDKAKKTRAYLDMKAAESLENAVDADLRAIKKQRKHSSPQHTLRTFSELERWRVYETCIFSVLRNI